MGVDKRPRLPARPRPPRTCPWRGGPPAPPPPPLCHQNHHNHRRRRRSNRKCRHLACVFSASRSTMERNAAVRTRRHLWPDGRTDGSLSLSRFLSLSFTASFPSCFHFFFFFFFNFSYNFSLEMMIYFSCLERSRLKNRNEC